LSDNVAVSTVTSKGCKYEPAVSTTLRKRCQYGHARDSEEARPVDLTVFSRENVLASLNIDHYMNGSISLQEELQLSGMTADEVAYAKMLCTIFVATTKNAKRVAIRQAPGGLSWPGASLQRPELAGGVVDKNGFAAWRRLCRDYQLDISMRYMAVHIVLMTPKWIDWNWLSQFHQWENDLVCHELDSGDSIRDRTRVAVVARWAPAEIKDYIRRSPADVTASYSTLREAILNYIHKARSTDRWAR
jgi:hypothetical protein